MKSLVLTLLLSICFCFTTYSQIKIGDNPQTINPSSVLELESKTHVLVITRVTTAEMEAIVPSPGGMVYNTDEECIHYYTGTTWINVCEAGGISNLTTEPVVNNFRTIIITEDGDTNHIEVGIITSENIQPNSIGGAQIAGNSITEAELDQGSVTTDQLADNTIEAVDFASVNPNQVLSSDINGIVEWVDSSSLIISSDTPNSINVGTDGGALYDETPVLTTIANEVTRATNAEDANTTLINNYITADTDTNATNEIQTIASTDGSVNIVRTVNDFDLSITTPTNNDNSATNEIQTITSADGSVNVVRTVNDFDLSITTPTNNDNSATNELQDLSYNTTTNVLTITNPANSGNEINLSALAGGGSDGVISNVTLTGTDLIFTGANGGFNTSVPLATLSGGSGTTEEADDITITGDGTTTDKFRIKPAPNTITENQMLITDFTSGTIEWANVPTGGTGSSITDTDTNDGLSDFNNLTGYNVNYDDTTIGVNITDQLEVKDNAITTAKLAPGTATDQLLQFNGTNWILITESDISATVTETDGIIGNEISQIADATLVLTGTGIATDPLTLDVATNGITDNEIANDAVTLPKLANGTAAGQLLQWNGSDWVYITEADISATVTETDGIIGNEISQIADATLVLTGTGIATDPLTLDVATNGITDNEIANDAVTLPKLANGTAAEQLLQWNGSDWVYITEADISATVTEIDGIIGNEISQIADATLVLTGTGIATDPLTLDVATNGITDNEIANNAITTIKITDKNVTLAKLADGTTDNNIIQWNAITTAWEEATPANLSTTNLTQTSGEDRTYNLGANNLAFSGSGRIGIGTTSGPSSKLQVVGQIRASSFASGDGTESLPGYRFEDDLNTGMRLPAIGELSFTTNSSEALRIIANQNVGINEINPLEKLHVGGNIRADGDILYSGNSTDLVPDYVFQKYFLGNSELKEIYNFFSLEEIEAFVRRHHHLPGIKSAEQVKKEGVWNLSESNLLNLEKIEELFLHTIEQEKKIRALEEDKNNLARELNSLKKDIQLIKESLLNN